MKVKINIVSPSGKPLECTPEVVDTLDSDLAGILLELFNECTSPELHAGDKITIEVLE